MGAIREILKIPGAYPVYEVYEVWDSEPETQRVFALLADPCLRALMDAHKVLASSCALSLHVILRSLQIIYFK